MLTSLISLDFNLEENTGLLLFHSSIHKFTCSNHLDLVQIENWRLECNLIIDTKLYIYIFTQTSFKAICVVALKVLENRGNCISATCCFNVQHQIVISDCIKQSVIK